MIDPWDILQGPITAFAYDLFKRSAKALAKILVKLPEKPNESPPSPAIGPSPARMRPAMHLLQTGGGQMRVDLRG